MPDDDLTSQHDRGSDSVPSLDWLDSYHQDMLQRVLDKDTPEARSELAARFTAELTDEIHTLRSDQKELGTSEQICAIAASGWAGWARFFIVASWVLVLIDSLIWFAGGTRILNIE